MCRILQSAELEGQERPPLADLAEEQLLFLACTALLMIVKDLRVFRNGVIPWSFGFHYRQKKGRRSPASLSAAIFWVVSVHVDHLAFPAWLAVHTHSVSLSAEPFPFWLRFFCFTKCGLEQRL